MLQKMRDKTQGLIAGGIAVLIALTFALWGIQNYLQSGRDTAVAKVDGKDISRGELHVAYEQAKRSEMYRLGKKDYLFDQKAQAELKRDVLQNLIKRRVLFQAGTQMGLSVTQNQLLSIARGMPIFQVNGAFSPDRFQRFVKALFGSEQAFFDEIESSFLQMQVERGVVASEFILPGESKYVESVLNQRRDFGYFMISPDRFIKKVRVSNDDIKKYYDENQSEFLLPEKISINYVELISEDLSKGIKPTEEQLKEFYKSRIASFSTPKEWQVTKVLLPLKINAKPEDVKKAKERLTAFAAKKDFAKGVSKEMKVTTSWLKRLDISPGLFSKIKKLRAGEVSKPFRTKEGYSIVKVLEIKKPVEKPYKNVAKKVKELYERQLATKAFADASDKLADLVYTNPDNLDLASTDLGLKVKETDLFANVVGKDGVLANAKVVKAAFSDVVLKQRYNSNLIEITPGHVVVLRIKEYIPEKLQPLNNKVRSNVEKKLKDKKAEDATSDFADKLLESLKKGESVAKLSEKYKLKWHAVSKAELGQRGKESVLANKAFDLAKPTEKNISVVKFKSGDEYAVIKLIKVYADKTAKDNNRVKNTRKFLPARMGGFDYQTLVESFMDNAKIEIKEKSLEK